MNIQFKSWNCKVIATHYAHDMSKAIHLIDANTHEPITKATVHVDHDAISDSVIAIKDYSENEGMVDTLVNVGIIHPEPVATITTNHVSIPMHELTELGMSLWDEEDEPA